MNKAVFKSITVHSPFSRMPTLLDTLRSLIHLPEKFAKKFRAHIWLLLPLLVTLLLQKLHDLVDDRFISTLGSDALAIHNVQYNLFLIGQEIGLASATSALIFWKRKEVMGKQGSVLWLHLLMPAILSSIAAVILLFFLGDICNYFNIPFQFTKTAYTYLVFGLVSLVFRSLYIPLNAILIACDQRLKSALLAVTILLAKLTLGWCAIHYCWDFASDPSSIDSPMMVMSGGGILILLLAAIVATGWISTLVNGWEKVNLKSVFKVWPGELGIAAISAISPIIFGFQVAKISASPRFFVTYQLALHLTCILTLPVIAGIQIAVRDASAEQSNLPEVSFKPLHEAGWWPRFFFASLVPTCLFLILAAIFAKPLFLLLYQYEIPKDHLVFLPVFYLGWVLWQFGNIFLIMLRASKKNGLATRNFIVAGLGVQVGVTQILIWNRLATPVSLGLVILAYCGTFLILNWKAISEVQSKYYLFRERQEKIRGSSLTNRCPLTPDFSISLQIDS